MSLSCLQYHARILSTIGDVLKEIMDANKDLRKIVSELQKKVVDLQEESHSSKKVKVQPSREIRVSQAGP